MLLLVDGLDNLKKYFQVLIKLFCARESNNEVDNDFESMVFQIRRLRDVNIKTFRMKN